MTIWSAEIKDLEKLCNSLISRHPKLEKEIEKLIKTDDENMVLVYARRCLEVIITDLSERELNKPRGTEPLKGITDKLNREGKVPENIITSMQSLNSMSTFGAHPKYFDPKQVKTVLLDLTTVIEWYAKYPETSNTGDTLKWNESMKEHWYWADDKYLAYLDTIFQKGGYLAVIKERIKVNEEAYSKGVSISLTGQAQRYLVIGNYDKAMDYYEKAYEEGFGQLAYVSLAVIDYPELKDNPRYVALLKKMNLPQ